MRKTWSPSSSNAPAQPVEEADNISDILKQRARVPEALPEPTPKRPQEEEPRKPEGEQPKEPERPKEETPGSASFSEKEEPKDEPLNDMFDPEGFAKTLIEVGSMLKEFFVAPRYDAYFFSPAEQTDLARTKGVVKAALEKNEEPELNNYQKMLLDKEKALLAEKLKISYTASEKDMLAKKLARHLEKIDFMKKLEKYDWLLVLAGFEGMRFMSLRNARNQFN